MSEIRNLTRNGETFYPLTCTEGLVNRDGNVVGEINDIFDVSEYNASGTPPVLAKYESLSLALAAVPDGKKKGGMTIRYVQTSDNKYVQYRYMSSSLLIGNFTNVANWQGIVNEPIACSEDLVNGNGISEAIETAGKDIGIIRKTILLDKREYSRTTAAIEINYKASTVLKGNVSLGTAVIGNQGTSIQAVLYNDSGEPYRKSITIGEDFTISTSGNYKYLRFYIFPVETFGTAYIYIEYKGLKGNIGELETRTGNIETYINNYINNRDATPIVDSNRLVNSGGVSSALINTGKDIGVIRYTIYADRHEYPSALNKVRIDYKANTILKGTLSLGTATMDSEHVAIQAILHNDNNDSKYYTHINIGEEFVINTPNNFDYIGFYIYRVDTLGTFTVELKYNSLIEHVDGIEGCLSIVNDKLINVESVGRLRSIVPILNPLSNRPFVVCASEKNAISLDSSSTRCGFSEIKIFRDEKFHLEMTLAQEFDAIVQLSSIIKYTTGSSNVIKVWFDEWSGGKNINVDVEIPSTYIDEDYAYVEIFFRKKESDSQVSYTIADLLENGILTFSMSVKTANDSSNNSTDILDLNPESEYLVKMQNLNRIKTYNPVGNTQLVLAHFSDIHASEDNLYRIIRWCNHYNSYIDDIIHTGDNVYNVYADGFDFWTNVEGSDKVLNCVGNHDASEGKGNISPNITAEMCYNAYFKDYIESWGVQSAGVGLCYYYKDYANAQIRLIVLDYAHFDSAQQTWFANKLTETVTEGNSSYGFSVLTASHSTPKPVNTVQCSFSSPSRIGEQGDGAPGIADIIDNFQTNQNGKYIAHISGHIHRDRIATLTAYPNQLQIQVDAASTGEGWMDKVRTVGTRSQDLFNIISIDTTEKVIRLLRVGAKYDRYARKASQLCYRYEEYTNQYGATLPKGIIYED